MPIFVHRFFTYTPSKPRHPVLRVLLGLGLVVLAGLVVVGLFVGLGMLMFAAVRRMLRKREAAPAAVEANVIDAQYTVIDKRTASLGLR